MSASDARYDPFHLGLIAVLHRFLDLLSEFRQEAQLLVVSHQKRTMEAADCLYGVTMAPGKSSLVVSERVATTA